MDANEGMRINKANESLCMKDDRSLIHVVQHLIEKCLLFYMDREECMACLQTNANLKPAITRAVWDELEKSNAEFFAAYAVRRAELQMRAAEHGASTSPNTTLETPDQKENQHAHVPLNSNRTPLLN
eukprot:c21270_g1_i1 orf=185-565(+)